MCPLKIRVNYPLAKIAKGFVLLVVRRFDLATHSVRQGDADVLHHALILVIKYVTVQDKITDIALVPCARNDPVMPPVIILGHKYCILPCALKAGIWRFIAFVIAADIITFGIINSDDLKRIDVDVEWMPA